VFIKPSADCADASPFHCDSGFARTTAKEASLVAAMAMAFAICDSLRPISRPAAAPESSGRDQPGDYHDDTEEPNLLQGVNEVY